MTELDWLRCDNPHHLLDHLKKTKVVPKWSFFSWLGFRRENDDARKLLLLAVACCRRIDSLLINAQSRNALDIAEKFADGRASRKELKLAAAAAQAAALDASSPQMRVGGWLAAAQARAAEAVAAALAEQDAANVTAAIAREAARTRAKASPASKPGVARPLDTPPISGTSWNASVIVAAPTEPAIPAEGTGLPTAETAWTNEAKLQCEYLRDIFGNPFQPTNFKGQAVKTSKAISLAKSIYAERSFDRLPEVADLLCTEGFDDAQVLAHCRQPRAHIRGCWVIDLLLGMEHGNVQRPR